MSGHNGRTRVAAGRLGASGAWRLATWLALEWLRVGCRLRIFSYDGWPCSLSYSPPALYNSPMAKRSDPFTVIVEQDEEGFFVASVPELRGCHTQARSLDVLMKRVAEAITLCLAEGPRQPRRTFIAVQQVQVA